MGAWIEILDEIAILFSKGYVAPLVGAWIEITTLMSGYRMSLKSLLSWERGLKSLIFSILAPQNQSLLSWERGLKLPPVS